MIYLIHCDILKCITQVPAHNHLYYKLMTTCITGISVLALQCFLCLKYAFSERFVSVYELL